MIGVGKSIWKVGSLLSSGPAAPPGEEIISAQVTYGALGTCQSGTLRTARVVQAANRMSIWTLSMAGEGNLFVGIVDQPTSNPGDLGQVTLTAPHRQYLDALGVNIGYPYPLRSFGVPLNTGVQDWEKVSDVLGRILDSYPTADYGVGPDLEGAIGIPDMATPVTLDVSQALSISQQGYSIPNYVTDAVFDPGDGWHKYTYRRNVPGYAPRITGQVTVNPATVTDIRRLPLNFFRGIEWFDGNNISLPQFDGEPHDISIVAGVYHLQIPKPDEYEKGKSLSITFPFSVRNLPDGETADWEIDILEIPEGQTQGNPEGGYSSTKVSLSKTDVGLEKGMTLQIPADLVSRGALLELYVMTGFSRGSATEFTKGSMVLYPPKLFWEYEHPNLGAIQMPEGWNAPVSVGPVYELKFPGWHIPPIRITGLPGGFTQMAAGSTVTHNRQEASTTVTTMAWPYAGQRR